jgi:hypothetical protein
MKFSLMASQPAGPANQKAMSRTISSPTHGLGTVMEFA